MTTADATMTETERPNTPPSLHIVCAYPELALAGDWFRVYRRLRHMVASEGLHSRLELLPISEIPVGVDIVIALQEVSEQDAAILAVLDAEVLFVPARGAAQVLKTLFERLREEGHTCGPVGDRSVEAASPRGYVRHRGFQRVL